MNKRLMGALLALTVAGCVSIGHKLDPEKMDQIKKGETTRDQTIALLGSPDQVAKDSDSNVTFSYIYSRSTPKPATFIPIVGLFAGGADIQNQTFLVTFGPNGIVKNTTSTYGASEADMGAASGGHAEMDDVEKNKRTK